MTEPNPARFLELCNRRLTALEKLQSWVSPEVADSLDSLSARLAAAEQRISELEGNPTPAANPAVSLEDAVLIAILNVEEYEDEDEDDPNFKHTSAACRIGQSVFDLQARAAILAVADCVAQTGIVGSNAVAHWLRTEVEGHG